MVGEESGEVLGVEIKDEDPSESSGDGVGERGGSSNTIGRSTVGATRVTCASGMKNWDFFRVEMPLALLK